MNDFSDYVSVGLLALVVLLATFSITAIIQKLWKRWKQPNDNLIRFIGALSKAHDTSKAVGAPLRYSLSLRKAVWNKPNGSTRKTAESIADCFANLADNYAYTENELMEVFAYCSNNVADNTSGDHAPLLQRVIAYEIEARKIAQHYLLTLQTIKSSIKDEPDFSKYPIQWEYELVEPVVKDKIARQREFEYAQGMGFLDRKDRGMV